MRRERGDKQEAHRQQMKRKESKREGERQRRSKRGGTTGEMTGGVAIETKEAPLISLETNSQETNTGLQRE